MKNQILYVHGGMTFDKQRMYLKFLENREVSIDNEKKWQNEYLDKELGEEFQIIRPRMPLRENARYEEWKIHFEKYFPYLEDNVVLIGQSLGAIFLVKYLSENKFPKKISSIHLVACPFNDTLIGERLTGGFRLGSSLSLLEENSKNIYFFFSKNDSVVPLSHMEKYEEKLKEAHFVILENINGHFQVSEFPEIIESIRESVRI